MCPNDYFIYNKTCINVCPAGTSRNNGTHCLDDLIPIVEIKNKTGSNEDWIDNYLLVSRKQDLVLQMDYIFNGRIE